MTKEPGGDVRRSEAEAALIVGTVLVAINHGTVLAGGTVPADLLWKVPLTYLVPFCVATWGALGNSRRRAEVSVWQQRSVSSPSHKGSE